MLEFDPNRNITPPREAATVVIIRDTADGLEVFCVRRHAQSAFMGGALVFPGGKLDANDQDPRWFGRTTAVDPRSSLFASNPEHSLALAVAACRETLEEGLILPTLPPIKDDVLPEILKEAETKGFLDALLQREIVLDVSKMAPFARWVTPQAEARRFDARFYLLSVPEGQNGKHDERETTMSMWAKPKDVLEAAAQGRFFLAPPTARTLELLANEKDVQGAYQLAARQTLQPVCPEFVAEDPPFIALPGDPAHSVPEKRVDGPTRYVLRDGRFVSEDPPNGGRRVTPPGDVEAQNAPVAIQTNPHSPEK